MKSHYSLLACILLLNGCSILVGQVKPVEEKATLNTPKKELLQDPNWKKLQIKSGTKSNEDIPDAAWQSLETAAVISLNSVCRQSIDEDGDIKEVSRLLMSQWDNLKIENEQDRVVSGFRAFETTAHGVYLNQNRKFQTVVVKSPTCVYDLVFLSPPKTFDQEITVFRKFRDNLSLK